MIDNTDYTSAGLVEHAKKAELMSTVYMWGGILRLVEKQIKQLKQIYGNQSGTGYSAPRWAMLNALCGTGVYGVDCVGLIKSYYWSGKPSGGTGSKYYGSDGHPDCSAIDMFNASKKKGTIATMPEVPGLIVFSKSHPHVGIYIGNGETIESTLGSRGDGVVRRKLDDFWEYWFECPYIRYIYPESTPKKKQKKTTEKIAREVIAGKWGCGLERRKKLAAAGYNPSEVQLLVNEILSKGIV